MKQELAKQVVQAFVGSLKGLRLYPVQHPVLAKQIQALLVALQSLSMGKNPVKIGVLDGALIVDEVLFAQDVQAADDLAQLLQELRLEGLQFEVGVAEAELRELLTLLHKGEARGEGVEAALHKRNVENIHLLRLDQQQQNEQAMEPREVYGRALKVMENIFSDVRMGKIPSSAEAVKVMSDMVKLTIAEPHALFALTMLKDYDNYTFTHSVNVSVLALAVGRACGLSEEQLRVLGLGGLLHDLGKLKVDVAIITKPGKLTEQEFEEIKKHPGTGAVMAQSMDGVTPEVIDIVLGHHLRYDRTGYPSDERGRAIGAMVYMAAIADTYDALTTLRSYQRATTPRKASEKLRELAGAVLHPEYVEKFIGSLGRYPVGTLIRLDSNEIGLVMKVGTNDPDAVKLKILFDANGARLSSPTAMELSGVETIRIVGEVDPFTKGVEVTDYF